MRLAQIVAAVVTAIVIFTWGFTGALLLIPLVVVSYAAAALLLPIYVRAKMRVEEKPAVQPISPDDPTIPADARASLQADRDALIGLGFEARDMIYQPGGRVPTAYVALYQHPVALARAMSRVMLTPGKTPAAIHSADVEFEIQYENGTTVELSNIGGSIPGLSSIPGVIRRMPHVREVPRLYFYFMKLVARYEAEAAVSAGARVRLPDDATLTEVYHSQVAASCVYQERAGLLVPTGVPGVWRPTWRMARSVAYEGVSPGAEIVKRRVREQGEILQRELDAQTGSSAQPSTV